MPFAACGLSAPGCGKVEHTFHLMTAKFGGKPHFEIQHDMAFPKHTHGMLSNGWPDGAKFHSQMICRHVEVTAGRRLPGMPVEPSKCLVHMKRYWMSNDHPKCPPYVSTASVVMCLESWQTFAFPCTEIGQP